MIAPTTRSPATRPATPQCGRTSDGRPVAGTTTRSRAGSTEPGHGVVVRLQARPLDSAAPSASGRRPADQRRADLPLDGERIDDPTRAPAILLPRPGGQPSTFGYRQ